MGKASILSKAFLLELIKIDDLQTLKTTLQKALDGSWSLELLKILLSVTREKKLKKLGTGLSPRYRRNKSLFYTFSFYSRLNNLEQG